VQPHQILTTGVQSAFSFVTHVIRSTERVTWWFRSIAQHSTGHPKRARWACHFHTRNWV